MAESLSLLAALCFAVSHVLIRRGLVGSNAITASLISLGLSALTLWILALCFVPLSSFRTHALWYFVAAGVFAPGLGRTLNYVAIERIGVARAVPVTNSSPMFASLIAVLFIDEKWTLLNFLGTSLIIAGVVILSRGHAAEKEWRWTDIIYPILAALSFGISANLRKLGLLVHNVPIMAGAVTAATAVLFAIAWIKIAGGRGALQLGRRSFGWLFAAGMFNTGAMISVFYALSFGKVVIVEPLVSTNPVLSILLTGIFLKDLEAITARVVFGGCCTVVGSILVVAG